MTNDVNKQKILSHLVKLFLKKGPNVPDNPVDGMLYIDKNDVMHVYCADRWYIISLLDKYYLDAKSVDFIPHKGTKLFDENGNTVSPEKAINSNVVSSCLLQEDLFDLNG